MVGRGRAPDFAAAARPRDRWLVLAVALTAQIGFSVPEQGLPTLAGFLKADLQLSAAATGLAVSSFFFGKLLGAYAAGVVVDRIGEYRVLLAGAFLSGMLLAVAMASPLPALFALVAVAGFASSGSTPAGGRLVLEAFAPHERGLALGIRQTGVPLGGLVAAVALPAVAVAYGWRWSLVVAGAMTVVATIPLLAIRPRGRPEAAAMRPVKGRLVTRDVRLLTTWSCLLVTGQFVTLTFLALDARERTNLSLSSAVLLVAVAQVSGILGRIIWGLASDRSLAYGRKPFLIALTAGGAISALFVAGIPASASILVWGAAAVLLGFTVIGYQGLFVTMLTDAVPRARVGAAMGFAVTFNFLAIAVTPPLYGLVADVAGTYRAVWLALFVVLLAALVPASLLKSDRPAV